MNGFQVRALELHDSASIWSPSKMQRVIDFMVKNDMNTLIYHENDIVDKVVFPGKLYGASAEAKNSYEIYHDIYKIIYHKKPSPFVFIDEKVILRGLLRINIEQAIKAGINVYLQTKELWFPDIIYESKLVKDGFVCPSEPFWWEEFLPAKYTELINNFPGISGVVTSTGTRESRASLAHGKCCCEKCRAIEFSEWQRNIITAIYRPLKQAGMRLVVRDFTYYSHEQNGFREGVSDLPGDIIVSIKNTPQDFYPTFPNNPLLGKVGTHEQWVEYEVMGEYFGFGVAPCILLNDIKERMEYALEKGARGFTARVDWEALPNHSCLDTPNILNLYGVAHLAKTTELPIRDIYQMWLTREALIQENLTPAEFKRCLDWVIDIFERTWPIMAKTPYINGYLFSTNSKIPICISHADFLAREHHGMQKWFPEKFNDFTMNEENVKKFLAEKEEAVAQIEELYAEFKVTNLGLKPDVYRNLLAQFDFFRVYVKMFYIVSKVYVLTKYLQENLEDGKGFQRISVGKRLETALDELKEFEKTLENYEFTVFKYPGELLISSERVKCFYEDAVKVYHSIKI